MDVADLWSRAAGPRFHRLEQEKAVVYTHYDYLELPPGASPARIEAAYQLIKQRLNGHSDESLVRLIHQAYRVLSNPNQRRDYDETLKRASDEADRELQSYLDERAGLNLRHVQDVPAPLLVAVSAWAA
jgi:DnaJ-class molecular chaperone